MTDSNPGNIVAFLRLAEQLKDVRRQGWLDRGVPEPESTAEHSWAVALTAWLLARERAELDADRVLLIALVHDLPEALAGDATPFDRHRDASGEISATHFRDAPTYDADETRRKHERERAALDEMSAGLPQAMRAALVDAWEEYNAGTTPEARFVREVDKLETLLQAEIYAGRHADIVIDSFRAGADRDVTDPALRAVLDALRAVGESSAEGNQQP